MSVSRVKNLKSGPLVLNSGFAEPVTLQSGQEINISSEVLLNAEIQRLIQSNVLAVVTAQKVKVNNNPVVEEHTVQDNIVVTVNSEKTAVKEKTTKKEKVNKTPKAAKAPKKTKKAVQE